MRKLLSWIVSFVVATCVLSADEGRIPVYAPTSITSPGHYFLTRDVPVSSGTAITIASDDVTVDLNGHLVSSSAFTGYLITVSSGEGIVIRNGRVSGGQRGVSTGADSIRIEDLEIRDTQGAAVYSTGGIIDVIGCRMINTASNIDLSESAVNIETGSGKVVRNEISTNFGHGAVFIGGFDGGVISGNQARGGGAVVEQPSILVSGSGLLVEKNLVIQGGGLGIEVLGSSNIITKNTVHSNSEGGFIVTGNANLVTENSVDGTSSLDRGNATFSVNGTGNRVERNQVVANFCPMGLVIGGSNNLVSRNISENNGLTSCGLRFLDSNGHAYLGNMLRGNNGGAVCGSSNTDAGGNIY